MVKIQSSLFVKLLSRKNMNNLFICKNNDKMQKKVLFRFVMYNIRANKGRSEPFVMRNKN